MVVVVVNEILIINKKNIIGTGQVHAKISRSGLLEAYHL